MININYQTYGGVKFGLRLRIYQDGETKYISVNRLLKGKLLKRHWNAKKQMFTTSAPFSKENNEILVQFKQKYDKVAINWQGSLQGFFNSIDTEQKTIINNQPTLAQLFTSIIDECKQRKHPDGTTKGSYEVYEKTERRLQEYCNYKHLVYEKLLVEDITSEFINSLFHWIDDTNKGKGKLYVSTMLHSVFVKADELGWINFDTLKGVKWCKKLRISANRYRTLTTIMALNEAELPSNKNKALFRDFCVFLLFTGQSPCDAISLKYSDIQVIDGVSHFVFRVC